MKKYSVAILFLFSLFTSSAQVKFQKMFTLFGDAGSSVFPSSDGLSYFFEIGTINSSITYYDVCLAKVNLYGDTLWTKYYGGGGTKGFGKLHEESNGNITMIGSSYIFGSGSLDNYIVKINSIGDTIWTKAIGNSLYNPVTNSIRLSNGDFMILTFTDSTGLGLNDSGLIKIDSSGNILWNKFYEGGAGDNGALYGLIQLNDGGFIMCGSTNGFGAGDYDSHVLRTDSLGNIIWQKTYGGILGESAISIVKAGNGFMLAGTTNGFGQGGSDILLNKIDINGNIIWTKAYGTTIDEAAFSIKQTPDNGFIIAGPGPHVITSNRAEFLMKIDSLGNFQWAKSYGTALCNEDFANLNLAQDGGYILAGSTCSFGGINYKSYIIKTDSLGNSGCYEQNENFITTDITGLLTLTNITSNVYSDTSIVAKGTQTIVTNHGSNLVASTLCFTNDVSEIENKLEVNIYPNPATNQITIEFESSNIENILIDIKDILGQTIYSESLKSGIGKQIKSISLDSISNGIYFIQLQSNNTIVSKKCIKK